VTPPLIYNLFQRLVGPTTRWGEHARRAREMEFNWLYINPWHYPGFSGSLYAPKEFRRLNPLFLPAGADPGSLEPLTAFLGEMHELGLPVMMDLVVNHTSKDCPLVEQHPAWYVRDGNGQIVSPSVVDPDDPGKITVWGDLAEIDNEGTPDREGLWGFWSGLVRDSLELGFSGFRCDAAYMVPAELWKHLIEEARRIRPDVVFFAETLGAPESAVLSLREAGFDYFFNSSKWWNFRDSWALEQHDRFGRIAPSISFPETHDTERLTHESGGDEALQRQRYAFAAAFSAGVMIPIGYEFGFRKRINVVETMPSDWERRLFDLRGFITRVNRLKLERTLLQGEGSLRPLTGSEGAVMVLERRAREGGPAGYLIVNTDVNGKQRLETASFLQSRDALRLHRVCLDDSPEAGESVPDGLELERAETAYVLPAGSK
jgi:starch synthase (maltosyl-transferring)